MALETFDDAHAQYLANVGYDVSGSAAEARLFIAAVRAMLAFPERAKQGRGTEVQVNVRALENQLTKACGWLARHPGSGSSAPRFASFRHSRS